MRTYLILFLFICASFVALPNFALASIEVHPRITLEEEYTDNLYLTDNNEEDDWITTVAPGISFSYDGSSADITLDYSLRYQVYADHTSENLDDFETIQRANITANFFAGRPFTLGVRQTITRESLDERNTSTANNELVNKSTVYRLSVTPQYRLQLSESFSLVFGYVYDRLDYVEAQGRDSEDHTFNFSLVKVLSSNTRISANYAYSMYRSDKDEDYDQQSYTLGLNHQVGPRMTIGLQGGFGVVEYDDGSDADTTDWMLDVSYRLTAPITLSLAYSENFSVSAVNGLTKLREASFGVAYLKDSLTADAELYWNHTEYLRLLREDKSYGSRASLTLPLSRALKSNFSLEYERAEFDDVINEQVDRYSAGTSLDLDYRRFLISLAYDFRMDDSDVNTNDFTNNTVTLSVSLRF